MYEIELKILGIDRAEVEKRLVSLGAKKIFDGAMHAIYYDTPDRFIQKKRGMLRLRKEGGRAVLTFKEYVENTEAKVREEREVEVSEFDTMRAVLESAGLSPWLEMKKHRTTYACAGIRFELDKYHGIYEYIPEFLEIEGADIESIHRYVELLGFRKEDCRSWDALQVAEYYTDIR